MCKTITWKFSVNKLAKLMAYPDPDKRRNMKVIAIANQKGGVGKSTSTINIAGFLATEHKKRVLVIDMDPQGNATDGLGISVENGELTIADVLCHDYNTPLTNIPIKKTYIENVSVLPSDLTLALAEMRLSSMGAKEFKLRSAMPYFKDLFDYVLIDCPPTFTSLTINAFTAANEILMPVKMSNFCMKGIDGFVQAMNFVNRQINTVIQHKVNIQHVLITFYDHRTNLSAKIEPKMKELFGSKVFESKIPVNIKIDESQGVGKCIFDFAPDSSSAKAYREVSKELVARCSNEQ